MSVIAVMVGLPGTGKSTLVSVLTKQPRFANCFVYSTDDYIEQYARENGSTYDAVFKSVVNEATRMMNDRLDYAIQRSLPIIWDQTNLGVKKRNSILGRFNKQWTKECHCILPPQGDSQHEDWDWRLASRPGKVIPAGIIRSMRDTYLVPKLDEGYDKVYYYDMYSNEVNYERHLGHQ